MNTIPATEPRALSLTHLTLLYAAFALLSIVANLGLQKLALLAYHGLFALPLSVVIGTGGGLVLKFLLDKRWIFRYRHRDLSHGLRSLLLYTLMGVATTVVFWGCEFGAWGIWHTEPARFAGGAFGLTLGYIVKYQLDRRFVFA